MLRKLIRLSLEHPRILGFGTLLVAFSSFGQTFFVSLLLPGIIASTGIGEGDFGLLYAGCTLAAGLLLPRMGRLLDGMEERHAAVVLGVLLSGALVWLGMSVHVVMLATGLFALRLFGQGGFPLLSMAVIGKRFAARRGTALSLTSLGFPVGEIVLPWTTVFLLGFIDWRAAAFCFAGLLLAAVLGPLRILGREGLAGEVRSVAPGTVPERRRGGMFQWLGDPALVLIVISSAVLPLAGTIVILYLVPILESKSLAPALAAVLFPVFALTRALTTLCIGPLIDRFTGLRLYPWTLLPVTAGLGVLWAGDHTAFAVCYFVMAGLGFGVGPVVTSALAEIYGTARLAEVRGVASSVAIISTALGPFLAGWAINARWTFAGILGALAGLAVVTNGLGFAVPFAAARRG